MRCRLSLALLLGAIVLAALPGVSIGQDISDHSRTNRILQGFSPLQLAPGDEGAISFVVGNPYDWVITNTTLSVEIYAFDVSGREVQVEELDNAPRFRASFSPEVFLDLGTIPSGDASPVELVIETTPQTPAGGFFQQGSYWIRYRLEFDYGESLHAILPSRGHFTAEEWAYATRTPSETERDAYRYEGNLNLTYLGERLGLQSIDGLLQDSSFGVKENLPLWPFYLLLGASVAASLLAAEYLRRERRG